MTKQARISYWFIFVTIVLVGWLHLATPLLTTLFSYFALRKLSFGTTRKWLPVSLFVIVVIGITYGLAHFSNQALKALPKIAETTIPSIIDWAEERDIDLPFTDFQSLKTMAMTAVKEVKNIGNVANFAKIATTQLVFLVIGCVVAISLFFNAQVVLDRGAHPVNNLYAACADEIAGRFRSLYRSFVTVMGAQILISTINTAVTSIYVFAVSLPHAMVVIGVTFFAGLLPILGNLISNTIIVSISFTISPKHALAALIFLVVIHKMEYFLNSKIIGDRIKNPIWLTLLGLILGEKLMGVPGMILAPVILNYLKVEASKFDVPGKPGESPDASQRAPE